eukprot:3126935-Rhodomonas_salina.1
MSVLVILHPVCNTIRYVRTGNGGGCMIRYVSTGHGIGGHRAIGTLLCRSSSAVACILRASYAISVPHMALQYEAYRGYLSTAYHIAVYKAYAISVLHTAQQAGAYAISVPHTA